MHVPRVLRLLATAALLLTLPSASAHGDVRIASGETLMIPAGDVRAFAFPVHYHRVFGDVDPQGASGVTLALYSDEAYRALTAGRRAEPAGSIGPLQGARAFNEPINCCDGAAWTTYHLVVANGHPSETARVILTAKTAHDGLHVGMSGAEPGIEILLLPSIYFGYLTYRAARGRDATPSGPRSDPRRLTRGSLLATSAALGTAAMAATWGAARYGGGAFGGLVAAAGRFLPSFGVDVLLGAVVIAWAYALTLWLRAYRGALGEGPDGTAHVLGVGLLQAVALLAVPAALVSGYGPEVLLRSALISGLPAGIVIAGSIHLARHARATRATAAGMMETTTARERPR